MGMVLKKEDIIKAVELSGYPLQTEIANYLREEFFVQKEWSFIDKETG